MYTINQKRSTVSSTRVVNYADLSLLQTLRHGISYNHQKLTANVSSEATLQYARTSLSVSLHPSDSDVNHSNRWRFRCDLDTRSAACPLGRVTCMSSWVAECKDSSCLSCLPRIPLYQEPSFLSGLTKILNKSLGLWLPNGFICCKCHMSQALPFSMKRKLKISAAYLLPVGYLAQYNWPGDSFNGFLESTQEAAHNSANGTTCCGFNELSEKCDHKCCTKCVKFVALPLKDFKQETKGDSHDLFKRATLYTVTSSVAKQSIGPTHTRQDPSETDFKNAIMEPQHSPRQNLPSKSLTPDHSHNLYKQGLERSLAEMDRRNHQLQELAECLPPSVLDFSDMSVRGTLFPRKM